MLPINAEFKIATRRSLAWFKASLPRRLTLGCLVAVLAALSACGPRTPEGRGALHVDRGKSYLTKKQLKKAVFEFKVAAQSMPKDAEPVYQLGMTYLAGGNR